MLQLTGINLYHKVFDAMGEVFHKQMSRMPRLTQGCSAERKEGRNFKFRCNLVMSQSQSWHRLNA